VKKFAFKMGEFKVEMRPLVRVRNNYSLCNGLEIAKLGNSDRESKLDEREEAE